MWEGAKDMALKFPEKNAHQWMQEILYTEKHARGERGPNLWNAYLSSMTEARNAERK